jgi:hypothetical protein
MEILDADVVDELELGGHRILDVHWRCGVPELPPAGSAAGVTHAWASITMPDQMQDDCTCLY